jgi:hypothetical protein
VIVVHDAELLAKPDDATGTTACKLLAETVEQIIGVDLGGLGSTSNLLAEERGGKLFVVNRASTVQVVEGEKRVEILSL